ncbi:MAG: hypothetical protein JW717_07870 [Marinilabiliaceae bacterium]|nr:hypothetical protein [Marinilabiliaceae bacterium]
MSQKILGLDLGTNSIGWAVVDAEFTINNGINKVEHYNKIDDAGVRIFPEGVTKDTIGKGDAEQTKNATRRDKRQLRRQFYRKRLRKIKLFEVLIDLKMCPLKKEELLQWKNWDKTKKTEGKIYPNSTEFKNWLRLNPYELRSKALTEKLTLTELGRVFYHLIQRRGFLSNRKGKEDTSIFTKGKPEENILSINETKEKVHNSTLGTYLYSISYKEKTPYKTITDETGKEIRLRGRYTTRSMYIAEFEKIWQIQSQFSNINEQHIKAAKTREIKGSLTGKRNKHRIEYLTTKYGKDNITIERGTKGITKLISWQNIPLKEFLAGKIEENELPTGEKTLLFKSNDSVLFWQRPLRSQKSLLANCSFENQLPVIDHNGNIKKNNKNEIQTRSKKPCPLSHPEFELFRAWQFINTIYYGKNKKLTNEQSQIVLDLINSKDANFDFGLIPQKLNLTYEKFNYDNKHKVAGNPTIKKLSALFKNEILNNNFETIWHCFYFYEDDEKLYGKLCKDYNCTKSYDDVKKVRLKEGYSNISLKAIRNILPFLQKGYTYDRAVILGGVKNAFGKRWENFEVAHPDIEKDIRAILAEDNKEGEAIEKIKEYLASPIHQYGFRKDDAWFAHLYHHSQKIEKQDQLDNILPPVDNLRNPIVQQALNETRRLVNSLLLKYRETDPNFQFTRIHVEMGRDLRNSKKQRQEMSYKINENNAKNEMARARLAEYGLQPTRTNIQKYLMYRELEEKSGNACCPYTGKIISISDALGTDANTNIQIEHIIPYSVSLDDSFGNKTLCEAEFNNAKGEKTPYQFFLANPDPKLWGIREFRDNEEGWEQIAERAFRVLPYVKAKRFTSKKAFEKDDFIERQLNDSRYIAKKAAELMHHICHDVRVMPGQVTAELRHLWGLNNLLQPVENITNLQFNIDDNKPLSYYVIRNNKGEAEQFIQKYNDKPKSKRNELFIAGQIEKNIYQSKDINVQLNTPELADGNYWAKLTLQEQIKLTPIHIDKPVTDENEIVFRGNIEKGNFKNDTLGRTIGTKEQDGSYWAKFTVLDKSFEEPQKDQLPKTKRNQILLYGNVSNGHFKCYIYQCATNLPDGKFWIILDLDFDSIEFIRAKNQPPKIDQNQLLLITTVDNNGLMVADADPQYIIKTTQTKPGKYFATISINGTSPDFYKMENEPPKIGKDKEIVEGQVWVDKSTGEIKFDPKKNREDHRHHAIDAITIALTEQGYLQRLSTENANRKEKQRGKGTSTEKFPEPWLNFANDVKKVADGIIISHKKNNKTLTKNKKGFSVRGQLHKENIYGNRKAPMQEEAFHRRTKITSLENNKHVEKVVDPTIKELIINHIKNKCNVNTDSPKGYSIPKDAFWKNGQWQLFLPNKKGDPVPIKKIRIKETIGNAMQLKSSINQYVNPRNNHHVLIYKDHNNNLKEDVVSFWTVTERKLQGGKTYQLPNDGKEIVSTLEINDMFILGLSNDEYNANRHNRVFLNQYLYRVQKLSASYYTFRHHLASTITNKNEEVYIQSFAAWQNVNPIKVKISELGHLIPLN